MQISPLNSPTALASFVYQTVSRFDIELSGFSAYMGRIRYIAEFTSAVASTRQDICDIPVDVAVAFDNILPLDPMALLGPQFSNHNLNKSIKILVHKVAKVFENRIDNCGDLTSVAKSQLLRICQTVIRRHQASDLTYGDLCANLIRKTEVRVSIRSFLIRFLTSYFSNKKILN